MAVGPPVPPDIVPYITNLQKDGRLLLRQLIRRSDCALQDIAPVGTSIDGRPSDALFVAPDTVAADAARIAELVNNVDLLSRRAAPANVRSIRLTSAYLNMRIEDGEPPPDVETEVDSIRRYMWMLGIVAFTIFLFTVGLLAHADHGRRLLQQLTNLQKEQAALQNDLILAAKEDFSPAGAQGQARPAATGKGGKPPAPAAGQAARAAPFCEPAVQQTRDGAPPTTGPFLQPTTPKAVELCRRHDDLVVRSNLVHAELADWSCVTHHIIAPWLLFTRPGASAKQPEGSAKQPEQPEGSAKQPDSCGGPPPDLGGDDLPAWRSHDARVSASSAVMNGFVLPMLLGFLGGCAYAFRHLDSKLASWTLEPQDGKHAIVRVCLAAMLGGLVGVIWTSDENVALGGFTLSLAATAFFVGFSVEVVFKLIQNLIDTVASGIRAPPPAPAAAPPPMSEAQVRRITREARSSEDPPDDAGDKPMPGPDGTPPPATQAGLAEVKDRLIDQKQALTAIAQLGKGSPASVDAPAVIDQINNTLASIQPLLEGKPDSAALATVAKNASETLASVENAALPGILADGIATLKGASDLLGPVLAGIPGGPVGIIGGIVLGGLQLFDNEQKFQAMKAALLRQPFDPTLRSRVPDAVTALAALEASPLLSSRLANAKDPRVAMDVMTRLLQRDATGELPASSKLAFALFQPDDPLGLAEHFASATELAAAIEEYRSGMVFAEASKKLDGSVMVPETGVSPSGSISLQRLANAVLGLHADPRASAAIERTVAIAEALAKLPAGPRAAIELVQRSLATAVEIAQRNRQSSIPT